MKKKNTPKRAIHVSIEEPLCAWVDQKIQDKTFYNVSHAIEVALTKLKENYEREKEPTQT